MRLSGTGNTFTGGITFNGGRLEKAFLEASPASGTTGALSTGGLTLGTSGSFATLNLGGSPSTVTEVCNISAGGTGQRRIAVIGAGDDGRITLWNRQAETLFGWRVDEGTLSLSVTDSGHGIDPAQMGNLFRPFERLGAQRSAVEGTGLGLALSRQLARAMGGDILVDSRPGEGSTFTLRLPLSG